MKKKTFRDNEPINERRKNYEHIEIDHQGQYRIILRHNDFLKRFLRDNFDPNLNRRVLHYHRE